MGYRTKDLSCYDIYTYVCIDNLFTNVHECFYEYDNLGKKYIELCDNIQDMAQTSSINGYLEFIKSCIKYELNEDVVSRFELDTKMVEDFISVSKSTYHDAVIKTGDAVSLLRYVVRNIQGYDEEVKKFTLVCTLFVVQNALNMSGYKSTFVFSKDDIMSMYEGTYVDSF